MGVELKNAVRLISPRDTFLISSRDAEGRMNLAPFSWVIPVSNELPLVCVAIGKNNKHTLPNIKETKEFVLNLVSEEFGQKVLDALKIGPGENWKKIGLQEEKAEKVKVAMVKESKVKLECELHKILDIPSGDHELVIGKIVHAVCDEMVSGKFPDLDKVKPLMHVSGNRFRGIGEEIELEK